jgi:His/Glu/Gln/Arg/opine family amino acid ABC transporter permease subunit
MEAETPGLWQSINAVFDLQLIWNSLPALFDGLLLTIELVAISLIIGLAIAVPLAIMRASGKPWLSGPIYAYTYFFRGTPLLVQIFLIYYGLGQFHWIKTTFLWSFFREGYWCCLLAFVLNTAAYVTEIFRGAIQAVPHGEVEAAKACGMSWSLRYRRIILPRALQLVLPAYSNEVIFMLQASSLASVVTLMDLTGVARVIIARTFAPYEIFITIALIYLALTYLIAWGFKAFEWRLTHHLRDRPIVSATRKGAAAEPAVEIPTPTPLNR